MVIEAQKMKEIVKPKIVEKIEGNKWMITHMPLNIVTRIVDRLWSHHHFMPKNIDTNDPVVLIKSDRSDKVIIVCAPDFKKQLDDILEELK